MNTTEFPPVVSKVQQNGASLSVYLPQKVLDRWPIKKGDFVGLSIQDGFLVICKIDLRALAAVRAQRNKGGAA